MTSDSQKEQLPPWEAVTMPFMVLLLGHLSAMRLPFTKEETGLEGESSCPYSEPGSSRTWSQSPCSEGASAARSTPPSTLWVILQTCHCTCQSPWWFPMNEAKALPRPSPTSLSAWASPSFPHLHPPLSLRSPPPPLQPGSLHSCLGSLVPQ